MSAITINPILDLRHIESMTLNGDVWDGQPVVLTWNGVGNTIVITYKPEAIIEDWPNFRWYWDAAYQFVNQARVSGNVYTANFKYEGFYDGSSYDLEITSFMETEEVSSPFNRLYLMDRDNMIALSEVMPELYPTGGPGSGYEARDNSGYILNMLLLPFKIPVDVVGSSISIKIGDNDTLVSAPMVIDDSIDVDLGNITISGSDSVTDFVGVEYELHLPFSSKILKLNASEVVGKPISVKYDLDAYSGDISINVFNGGQYPFASETDRVGRGIPFRLFNDPTNGMDKMISLNNGLLSAYIKETRVELADGMYNNLILVDGVLGDSTGYVEVENCDLRGVPETAKVLSLLKGGVVIR